MALRRIDRTARKSGGCNRCGAEVPAALLWTIETDPGAAWCAACLTLDMWHMLAQANLAPEEGAPTGRRCDRCLRRSRPTVEHCGFQLCGECLHWGKE